MKPPCWLLHLLRTVFVNLPETHGGDAERIKEQTCPYLESGEVANTYVDETVAREATLKKSPSPTRGGRSGRRKKAGGGYFEERARRGQIEIAARMYLRS